MKKATDHSFEWGITAEGLPDNENRVNLDPSLTDSDGITCPKIIYKSSQNTQGGCPGCRRT
jgi:hypothetical protein